MGVPFMKSAAVAVVLALSTLASAQEQEAPGIAGRVALVQGEVTLQSAQGRGAATVNWPVTGGDVLATARGARAEVRVGSTAVRLDGDSSLEVVRLDDDTLRLRLYYGSVNVRVMNRALLDSFEVATPHGSVRMTEPGRLRVNAERAPQTTSVHVFEGTAVLAVPGSMLTVREGRSASAEDGDVRTGAAIRDGFDDWAWLRDLRDDRAPASRYITREITGYEELDQYGSWQDSDEYGPLWSPRGVPAGWAPYRDGRWTWVAPWGWTWVDNAPWGYAPSHYGRWVMVGSRWCWAPGRRIARPVWAPALVGWIGGANWQLSFGSAGYRHMPAQGWYPLSPYDAFVPHYRARKDHLRHINHGVRPPHGHRRRGHPHGLTVVPQEHFGRHGVVDVRDLPRAAVPPAALPIARVAPPPVPQRHRYDRDERGGLYSERPSGDYVQGRGPLLPNPQPQPQPAPLAAADSHDERSTRRLGDDDMRSRRVHRPAGEAPQGSLRPRMAPPVMEHGSAPAAPAAPLAPPALQAREVPPRDIERRNSRGEDGWRPGREARFGRDDAEMPRHQRREPAPDMAPLQGTPPQRLARPEPAPAAPPPPPPRSEPAPMAVSPPAAAPVAAARTESEPARVRRGPGKAHDGEGLER